MSFESRVQLFVIPMAKPLMNGTISDKVLKVDQRSVVSEGVKDSHDCRVRIRIGGPLSFRKLAARHHSVSQEEFRRGGAV